MLMMRPLAALAEVNRPLRCVQTCPWGDASHSRLMLQIMRFAENPGDIHQNVAVGIDRLLADHARPRSRSPNRCWRQLCARLGLMTTVAAGPVSCFAIERCAEVVDDDRHLDAVRSPDAASCRFQHVLSVRYSHARSPLRFARPLLAACIVVELPLPVGDAVKVTSGRWVELGHYAVSCGHWPDRLRRLRRSRRWSSGTDRSVPTCPAAVGLRTPPSPSANRLIVATDAEEGPLLMFWAVGGRWAARRWPDRLAADCQLARQR